SPGRWPWRCDLRGTRGVRLAGSQVPAGEPAGTELERPKEYRIHPSPMSTVASAATANLVLSKSGWWRDPVSFRFLRALPRAAAGRSDGAGACAVASPTDATSGFSFNLDRLHPVVVTRPRPRHPWGGGAAALHGRGNLKTCTSVESLHARRTQIHQQR